MPQSSTLLTMGTETNKDERNTPEYLAQLLKDKKQIQAFPNVFVHLEKLLDEGKFRAENKRTCVSTFSFKVMGILFRNVVECSFHFNAKGFYV